MQRQYQQALDYPLDFHPELVIIRSNRETTENQWRFSLLHPHKSEFIPSSEKAAASLFDRARAWPFQRMVRLQTIPLVSDRNGERRS
jgi:hypothetical protein